jgi:hypothetical protein
MGFSKVPVTLMDDGVSIPTEMIAGSVAIRGIHPKEGASSQGAQDTRRLRGDGFDTIQPVSGWFMYLT